MELAEAIQPEQFVIDVEPFTTDVDKKHKQSTPPKYESIKKAVKISGKLLGMFAKVLK